jgi:amino acid adenylation domain-containing protein
MSASTQPMPDEAPLFDRRQKEERDYWVARLTPAPRPVLPIPELPPASGAAGRERSPTPATSAIDLDWPAEIGTQLCRLARGSLWLVYVALAAALEVCLHRLSGERSVSIGSAALLRARPAGAPPAANAIAVVDEIDPERSFRAHLLQVRATLQEAHDRQGYPFSRLLEDLRLPRQDGRCPLFDAALSLAGLHGDLPEVGQGLTLRFALQAQGLTGRAHYDRRRFNRAGVARFAAQLGGLLAAALASLDAPLAALDLLSPAERHQLLVEWNDAPLAARAAGPLLAPFEEQVARQPDAVALSCGGERLTYGELGARVHRLARRLRSLGAGPEVVVALALPAGIDAVAALLAVLAAGAAYLPLDPENPGERLAALVADSRAALAVGAGPALERLAASLPAGGPPHLLRLDHETAAAAHESPRPLASASDPANVAYVIYTSGSTGRPKGVAVEGRQLLVYIAAALDRLAPAPGSVFALVSTLAADLGHTMLFPALWSGGRLLIARQPAAPGALAAAFEDERPDLLKIVPGHLRALLDVPRPQRLVPGRTLVLGGEAPPPELLERVAALAPGCTVWNHYGPTETTVGALAGPLAGPGAAAASGVPPDGGRRVALGRPLAGARVYLLDAGGGLVPAGGTGEICIGGATVARGYLGQPAATAARFVPDPFAGRGTGPHGLAAAAGARLYSTGDLARHLPDGRLEFLGRLDHQVKIRGFRIELGEIEAALGRHPALRQSVVMAREHPAGADPYLVAYVAAAAEPAPTAAELRAWLLAILPEPMVPAVFVPLAALPLTPRGKVDRRALPAPRGGRPDLGAAYVAPRSASEQVVAALWAELLGLERVGARDSFFDLGGHSLLATRLVARLQRVFQVELPLLGLFEQPTLEGVVAQIAGLRGGAEVAEEIARLFLAASELPEAERTPGFERLLRDRGLDLSSAQEIPRCAAAETAPLSLSQEGLWFREQLEGAGAAYNLSLAVRLAVPLDRGRFECAVDEIVRRHESLRTSFRVEGGVPVQVVAPARHLPVTLVDLAALPPAARHRELRDLASGAVRRRFDLARGPLLRVALARLAAADFVLLLTLHHIVADGWSMAVLVGEIAALYGALSGSLPSPRPAAVLPELRVHYRDFARWQRQQLAGGVLEAQLDYWRRQLAGSPPRLRLPTDRFRPALQGTRGGALPFPVAAPLAAGLRALGRQEGATLFMVLLAGWKILLRAYAGQDDIVVGTFFANRARREVEGLIGFFVNTLVLRTDLGGDPTCRELLARVRRTTLGAYAHQDLPFSKLVEALAPVRDPGYNPLFQVVLSLDNFPPPKAGASIAVERVSLPSGSAKFDLALEMKEAGEALEGLLEWNADLFEPATTGRMLAQYRTILQWMVDAPDRPLSSLSLAGSAGGASAALDFNEDLEAATI